MKSAVFFYLFFVFAQSAFGQDLVITNTDYSDYYISDATRTYTVTVSNVGPEAATNVSVNFPIPAGIEYMSWWGSNGSEGTFEPLVDLIAELPAGSTLSYVVQVEVPIGMVGPLVTEVVVTSDTPDPNPGCAQCLDADAKANGSNVVLTNTNNQSQYIPGSTITYEIKLANLGPLTAANIAVSNPIPLGVTEFSWVGNGEEGINEPLEDVIASLENGASIMYTIILVVPDDFTGTLTNAASFSTPTYDPVPGCGECTDIDIPVGTGADLSIINSDGINYYTAGTTTEYTIAITNNGPDAATDVFVSTDIPVGIPTGSFSWVGSNGSFGNNIALSDEIPSLANGETITYTITVSIPASFTGALVSATVVTSSSIDPTPTCSQCVDVDNDSDNPTADLVITKSNGKSEFVNESEAFYTITITNLGPNTAVNVQVADTMPIGITAMKWTASDGATGNGSLLDSIPFIEPGQVVVYFVSIAIPEDYSLDHPLLENTVSVESDTPDPTPACGQCTDTDDSAVNYVTIVSDKFYMDELVEDVLIHFDCAEVSNITNQGYSGPGSGSTESSSIGYFERNNADFPFKEGIVITTGIANNYGGHFIFLSEFDTADDYDWPLASDSDLQQVSDAYQNAISAPTAPLHNVSYIEFDFVPTISEMSFRFLFASNEYGWFQCDYSDVLAFLLTDNDAVTFPIANNINPVNIATIPDDPSIPVRVTTVRDDAYNSYCDSQHEWWFGQQNMDMPANQTPINLAGQLQPMTAKATVIPNHHYTLKIAIGDYATHMADSAVFIEAGSFKMGQVDITGQGFALEEFPDLTGPAAGCPGFTRTLHATLSGTSNPTYEWYRNDLLLEGESGPSLVVSEPGIYSVIVATEGDSNCVQSDTILVQFAPDMPLGLTDPTDLSVCLGLNWNLLDILPQLYNGENPSDYEINFHLTEETARVVAGVIPFLQLSNFSGFPGQTIWISAQSSNSDCIGLRSFTLQWDPCFVPGIPPDLYSCEDNFGSGTANFDISNVPNLVLDAYAASDFNITVHNTQTEADEDANPLDVNALVAAIDGQKLYVRMESTLDNSIFLTTSFTFYVNPAPAIPVAAAIVACDAYTLPDLLPGSHYESEIGTPINPGTNITTTQSITIIAESDTTPNCTSQSWFLVTINQTPLVSEFEDITACGSYELPSLAVGDYYSEPFGNGAIIPAGSTITESQVIYIYAETESSPNCFSASDFEVTIIGPQIANPNPSPLILCDPNNDCYGQFDLSLATADISGGLEGFAVTYYETEEDAQNGWEGNQLQHLYSNISPCQQTIYVRIESENSSCISFTELQLIVNPTPQGFEGTQLYECDTNGDGVEAFNLEQEVPTILNGLDTQGYTVRFYTDESAAALAGTNYIQGTLGYASTGGTIWATVVDNATGCSDVVAVQLTVRPVPNIPQPVPSFTKCDEAGDDQAEFFDLNSQYLSITLGKLDLEVTFYVGQEDALAGENAIENTSAYPNFPAVQTLWIRVEDPFTACFSITTMDLRVEPLPNPIIPSPTDPLLNICDGNQDGYTVFDLTALISDMQQGVPEDQMVIHFYETQTDAELQVGEIENPGAYANVYPFTQVIWVGALNSLTGCYRIISVTLNVLSAPIASFDIPNLEECDEFEDTQDGVTYFDLAGHEELILAAQGGAGFEVEYFLSEEAAEEGTSPIIPANQYIGADGQQIWFRIQNSDSDCFSVNSFMLNVSLPLDVPTSLGKWEVCDDDLPAPGLPTLTWNLSQVDIPGVSPSDTVVYYPGYLNALAGINAFTDEEIVNFTNTQNPQNIGITVTTAAGCVAVTSFTISVLPLPWVQDITERPLHECDDDTNPGTEVFDLTLNQMYMANGDEDNLVFEYYLTQEGAENQITTQQIVTPETHTSSTGSVWIRVEKTGSLDSGGEFCYVVVEQRLLIDPIPQLNAVVQTLYGCETDGNSTAEFDLTEAKVLIMAEGQSAEGISFSYYLSQADADLQQNEINNYNAYANTSDQQLIYVVATFEDTACFSIGSFILEVEDGAIANDPGLIATVCADVGGMHLFDLVGLTQAAILGSQPSPQYAVAYYTTEMDALAGNNPINTPTAFNTGSATIYAVVTNTISHRPCTSGPVPFLLNVEPSLNLAISGENVLCIDYLTGETTGVVLSVSGIPQVELDNYTYKWFLDGTATAYTASSITAIDEGSYTVVATSNGLDCESTSSPFEVTKFSINPDIGYIVSGAFQDKQSLTVNVEGINTQEILYSIDNGAYTVTHVFSDLSMGTHMVRIYTPCGDFAIEVSLINYPHYFTPNDDGFHDTWNVIGLENDQNAAIYIFDRYGKLLKQISPAGEGWDGTYIGRPLPSSDYWFTAIFNENGASKEFKAHFSLKR